MSTASFQAFFGQVFGDNTQPHDWQIRLALDPVCKDRLIRIPAGFGKTAGVMIAWLWNRVQKERNDWPRRLVLCLPMRTLVEQSGRAVQKWLGHTALNERGLRRLRKTRAKRMDNIAVTLIGIGKREAFRKVGGDAVPELGSSTAWVSRTPFITPRFLKTRGKDSIQGG